MPKLTNLEEAVHEAIKAKCAANSLLVQLELLQVAKVESLQSEAIATSLFDLSIDVEGFAMSTNSAVQKLATEIRQGGQT